jgi:hypothetical protein
MVDGYRLHFAHTADRLAQMGRADRGRTLLNDFTADVPFSVIPGDLQTMMFTARALRSLGETEKLAGVLQKAQPVIFSDLRSAGSQRQFSQALFYAGRVRTAYQKAGNQEAVNTFDAKLEETLAQAPYRLPNRLRRAYGLASDTTAGQPSRPMQMPGGGNAPPAPGSGN